MPSIFGLLCVHTIGCATTRAAGPQITAPASAPTQASEPVRKSAEPPVAASASAPSGPSTVATRDFRTAVVHTVPATVADDASAGAACQGTHVSADDMDPTDRLVTSDGKTAIELDPPAVRFLVRDRSGSFVPDPHRGEARIHMADARFLILHPSETEVAASGGARTRIYGTGTDAAADEERIHLFDVASGRETELLVGHPAPIQRVEYSATGRHLASKDARGGLYVWPGRRAPAQHIVESGVVWFAFLGDERLVYMTRTGRATVWHVGDGLSERQVVGRAVGYVTQDGAPAVRCLPALSNE